MGRCVCSDKETRREIGGFYLLYRVDWRNLDFFRGCTVYSRNLGKRSFKKTAKDRQKFLDNGSELDLPESFEFRRPRTFLNEHPNDAGTGT
jgi:hypothetical protein